MRTIGSFLIACDPDDGFDDEDADERHRTSCPCPVPIRWPRPDWLARLESRRTR